VGTLLQWQCHSTALKACPHWFPKQNTLYPETGYLLPKTATLYPKTGDFIVRNGKFVSRNRIPCCQKWQLCIRKQDTLLPYLATVTCFRILCILFREPVWTGPKRPWLNINTHDRHAGNLYGTKTGTMQDIVYLITVSIHGGHLTVSVDVPDSQRRVSRRREQQGDVLGDCKVLDFTSMSSASSTTSTQGGASCSRHELTQWLH